MQEMETVLKEGVLPIAVAERYLNLYVFPKDNWPEYLNQLWARLLGNGAASDGIKILMRKIVSFTILLPAIDRGIKIDPDKPERLLFGCSAFSNFNEKDWFVLLQKVIERDMYIEQSRKQVLALGIIEPIDYAPITRQAFNWLAEAAVKETKKDLEEETTKRFKSLIWAYGGAAISNIFTRHEETLTRVANWRTGYFFERILYEVYTLDQLLKIKAAEIQNTNSKLVRTL